MTIEAPVRPRAAAAPAAALGRQDLISRVSSVRHATEKLCAPLCVEDMVAQSMPDASPTKWHLAHTTWFFEAFVLRPARPERADFNPAFNYLFNSYYNTVGEQFPRPRRGLVTRPTVAEVWEYRHAVEERLGEFLADAEDDEYATYAPLVELGLNHEQQHQELLITDVKHLLSQNPLWPVYRADPLALTRDGAGAPTWVTRPEGIYEIGASGPGFAYDNEGPRHRALLGAFAVADRLVTSGEWMDFMEAGGYDEPGPWLSEGWATVRAQGWRAPAYWMRREGAWHQFTLQGLRPVDPAEPVCHVSFFEADAFARWAGARLPTELEWEAVAADAPVGGHFVEDEPLHPTPAGPPGQGARQLFGDVWEWTASAYLGYPGYHPPEGAVGEYNGKFMSNQMVLRGGSVATPRSHIRPTYRNFFPPSARWQFSGLRLARDA